MTWIEQLELLRLMQNWLGPQNTFQAQVPRPEQPNKLREFLQELESRERENVDAAVRAFARTSKAPTLSATEKYFLSQRVEFAVWVTLALVAPDENGNQIVPNPPDDLEKDEQTEWLLIWAWRVPGVRFWLEKAILNESSTRSQ